MEPRLALAYSASLVTLTTEPLSYAWNIVLDDAVDAQGYGRDLYIRRGDDASPYALIADNPEFRDSQRLGLQFAGPVSTFYVTTGGQQAEVDGTLVSTPPAPLPPGVLPVTNPRTGVYTFDLPSENPLALNGRVDIAPGVSFTYSGVGLIANQTNALTLTVNNGTAWTGAGLNSTPTGTLTTVGGVSTLTFRLFDTNNAPVNSPGGFDLTNAPYLYFNPFPATPFSFNVVAGQGFDQRLIVDLAGTGSKISVKSPWSATRGDVEGDRPGVNRDPFFYSAYSGLDAAGQVCLYASEVSVEQLLGATSTIDVGNARARSDRLTVTCDLVRGSTVVTNIPASTIVNVAVNDFVFGPGISEGTQVVAVDQIASAVTLSSPSAINANTASITFVTARPSGYVGLPYALNVTAEMRAPALSVLMAGNDARDGSLVIAQSGRFARDAAGAAAGAVTIVGSDTDVYVEGWINAVSQNYVLRSSDLERQFDFTTRSRATGATVGTIGGGTLAANLGNLGGTTFDVRTQLDELRVDSGVDLLGRPYRNAITVSEVKVAANPAGDGQLIVSAVAASSAAITIVTEDQLTFLGSAIRTSGDLVVDAGGSVLSLPATVTTGNGDVSVRGPALTTGSVAAGGSREIDLVAGQSSRIATRSVTAAGSTTVTVNSTARLAAGMLAIGPGIAANTTITAINGQVVTLSTATTAASAAGTLITFVSVAGDATIDAAVLAGGIVKERVRVATNMPLPALAGLLTVDGVDLSAGDRVLVKAQANAAQNGIYVASTGSWARAVDAALSSHFLPGFVVFAEEGQTQEGGWCFSNPANPIVGETGLMFEPVTATRTYSQVRLATTTGNNLSLFGTSDLVDSRQVNIGDRILVKDQTNRAENGIYVVTAGRWERADQADEVGELTAGSYVAVERAGITLGSNLVAGSTSITLATASIGNVLVGMIAQGSGVPAGTVVTAVAAPNTITLSRAATASGSSAVTFTAPAATDAGLTGTVILAGDVATGSTVVTALAGANGLTAGAVQPGMIVTGPGIPAGTTVLSVNSAASITLSAAATATAATAALTFTANTTTIGTNVIRGLRSTTPLRPGMAVVGANVPAGATVNRILNTSSIEISQAATATAAGTPLAFFQLSGDTNAGRAFGLVNDAVQVDATPLQFTPFTVQATRSDTWSPQHVAGSVRAATIVDIVLSGLQTIDGVAMQPGDRVLVKNQLNPVQNGIYVAAAGAWARSPDSLPRDTSIFVREGAAGRGTTWVMNDAVNIMGQLTSGSQIVRGLSSAAGLVAGMLAMGPGIQTGTTIELVVDATSVRLSRPPVTTNLNAILTFMGSGTVMPGSTPLAFIPAGGDASVTATGAIQSGTALSTSRVQSSTALLTAGRRPDGQVTTTGVIDTRVTTGRIAATAPESVTISAAGTLDVVDVRTTTSGGVTISAENTLAARTVIASAATGIPSPITLASTLGDVVVTTATTPRGDISLRADSEGRVFMVNGGTKVPGLVAQAGNVDVVTDNGRIEVAGRVVAGGTNADIAFRSARGDVSLMPTALVQAADQLVVVTPNAQLQILPGAVVTASRLALTAKLGALTSPPAALGAFTAIELNRTDEGNVSLVSLNALTIEGASTVGGSITVAAPNLTVTGPISAAPKTTSPAAPGNVTLTATAGSVTIGSSIIAGTAAPGDGDITVTATGGSIFVVDDLTAENDKITLSAVNGQVSQTAGNIDALTFVWFATATPTLLSTNAFTRLGANLTAPGQLRIPVAGAQIGTLILDRVTTVNGNVVIVADQVELWELVQAGGAGTSVSITAQSGNISFLGQSQVASTSGPVTLAANGAIVDGNGVSADVVVPNGQLILTSASGASLGTDVGSLTATITAGSLVVTEASGLTLAGVSVPVGSISITTGGPLTQSAPIVGNTLAVVRAGAAGNIVLTNPLNDIARLEASNPGGGVSFTDANGIAIGAGGIVAGNVVIKTQAGGITINAPITAAGGEVRLDAGQGLITQAAGAPIVSRALVWYAGAQPVFSPLNMFVAIGMNLTVPGNVVYVHAAGLLELVGASTIDGNVSITADAIIISDLVRSGGLGATIASVTATVGNVSFIGAGRIESQSGPINLSAATGSVSLVNGGLLPVVTSAAGLTVTSGGAVPVGTVTATGPMLITTTAPTGNVTVQPAGLLQSATSINLQSVAGTTIVEQGGRIIAPTVQLAAGKHIQLGAGAANIQSASALNAWNVTVDSLPAPPAPVRYRLVVSQSFPLTQSLVFNKPVELRGTSRSVVVSGTATVRTGLVLNQAARGSSVSTLTFANFADTAIRLVSNSNTTLTQLIVRDSGTGLAVNGASTGTVVRANDFNRIGTGIRLNAATGVIVGGEATGQVNTITNASQQGVFAQGFCTNSRVVKNVITRTRTPYNVAQSRNLTVVR